MHQTLQRSVRTATSEVRERGGERERIVVEWPDTWECAGKDGVLEKDGRVKRRGKKKERRRQQQQHNNKSQRLSPLLHHYTHSPAYLYQPRVPVIV